MLTTASEYEEFEWDDQLELIHTLAYDEDTEWFAARNKHVMVELFQAVADLDDCLRNIERWRNHLENKSDTRRLEKRVRYIRNETEDAKSLLKDIIATHNHLIHQGYDDVNTWFRSSGKSKHDYDSGDMSKQRREHQKLYLSYMRKILVQLHADIILEEDRFPDPAGLDCPDFTNLVKSFEENLHAFITFHWEMIRDLTVDVEPVNDIPTEEVNSILLENHVSKGNPSIDFDMLRRKVESKRRSEVTEDQVYRALRALDGDTGRAYQSVELYNGRDEGNIVQVMDSDLESSTPEELFEDKVILLVEINASGDKEGEFGDWREAESWAEFQKHVVHWYNKHR